jgi:hypothetical protein
MKNSGRQLRRSCFFFLLASAGVTEAPAHGQALPTFCEQVSAASLTGVSIPYGARRKAGRVWCEGILPRPVGVRALRVASLKQTQPEDVLLDPTQTQGLRWCDASAAAEAHVSLRAPVDPLYALDALSASGVVWSLEIVARQYQRWSDLDAQVAREMMISHARRAPVWLPVRVGAGASTTTYRFTIRGEALSLHSVLVESGDARTIIRAAAVSAQVSRDQRTAEVDVSFAGITPGIYRVSFSEGVSEGNRTTEPVYIYHGRCHAAPG